MRLYLICGVYTDGAHKGRGFILGKGGYVLDTDRKPLKEDCYSTERAAKMVATKLNKRNEFESKHCNYITPCKYHVSEINY